MPHPWDRLTNESSPAFEAFVIYRDFGVERSLVKVAQELGKSKALIERWSARNAWVKRVELWEADQDRLHRQWLVAHRRATDRRQLQIANVMQAKMVAKLAEQDTTRMTPRDLGYWLEVTADVQRRALGQGDRIELTGAEGGPVEIASLSPVEQKARMREIAAELARRAADDADEIEMPI